MSGQMLSVFIVMTWLKNPGRWFAWSAHLHRSDAWRIVREARNQHPGHKFKTVRFRVVS